MSVKYDWPRIIEEREKIIREQLEPYMASSRHDEISNILADVLDRLCHEKFYDKWRHNNIVDKVVEEYRVKLAVDVLVCVKILTEGV